ncbi:hypothetical protein [Phaeobacter sp.]|uniref:hypothetical protein n=1 Tax=Phaeobacter sp. TaxID=1902409 RepID=UPI0025F2D244|nr:hypothetical protein [Phaeobacter sp.]
MRYSVLLFSSILVLGGCGQLQWSSSILGPKASESGAGTSSALGNAGSVPAAPPVDTTPIAPAPGTTGTIGSGTGQTVDPFATTARPSSAAPARSYTGRSSTIASLGDPSQPGLWMETSLVSTPQRARLVSARGTEAIVTLRPSAGTAGAGSRLSIDAMRALGLPLTELAELQVLPAG